MEMKIPTIMHLKLQNRWYFCVLQRHQSKGTVFLIRAISRFHKTKRSSLDIFIFSPLFKQCVQRGIIPKKFFA